MKKDFLSNCDDRIQRTHPDGGVRDCVMMGDRYAIIIKVMIALILVLFLSFGLIITTGLLFKILMFSVFILLIWQIVTTDARIIIYWFAYLLTKRVYHFDDAGQRVDLDSKQPDSSRRYYAEKAVYKLFYEETSILY